jgi:hypothetical protein
MNYINDRIQPRITWYDKRAVKSKRLGIALDVVATGLSIALVFLIPMEEFSRTALSLMASLIALAIAAERRGSWSEQWLVYRLSAEALEREVQWYYHSAGPYGSVSNREALLVERTEALLASEASEWRRLRSPREQTSAVVRE